jgi:aspartate-semialdehyde dehydrogenase
MRKYQVGVIGATGMVGQRFVTLLRDHPWFRLTAVAASDRSAGKTYRESVGGRWVMDSPVPESAGGLRVMSAAADIEEIASSCDFVFSAVSMTKPETYALEERYARLECPVISNNSAHRATADVPMIIPEINPEHAVVIDSQRKRLGTRRGFIAVKSNCSIQSFVPALHPLAVEFGLERVLACTYQSVSGAGKALSAWPEMHDNVIPYIAGEEEKSESEPLKIWGFPDAGAIVSATAPSITTQCIRVPTSDGHLAAVFVSMSEKPSAEEIIERWDSFSGRPQQLRLPSAPEKFLHYFREPDRPQTKLDKSLEGGMAVSVGRLRPDTQYDYKFVCLSHNTLRGAAGGGVLLAELLCAEGYIDPQSSF